MSSLFSTVESRCFSSIWVAKDRGKRARLSNARSGGLGAIHRYCLMYVSFRIVYIPYQNRHFIWHHFTTPSMNNFVARHSKESERKSWKVRASPLEDLSARALWNSVTAESSPVSLLERARSSKAERSSWCSSLFLFRPETSVFNTSFAGEGVKPQNFQLGRKVRNLVKQNCKQIQQFVQGRSFASKHFIICINFNCK